MKPIPSHELVGARLVGALPSSDMVDLWLRVSSAIVKYGFVIEYRDLEPPRTGIFDGLRITIDPDVGFEMQCFLLLHLFGHSVQWVAPSLEHAVGERRAVAKELGHDMQARGKADDPGQGLGLSRRRFGQPVRQRF